MNKEHFNKKMKEIRDLKMIQITESAKDTIYEKVKSYSDEAMNYAAEELILDQERFNYSRLIHFILFYQNKKWENIKKSEDLETQKFWSGAVFKGECTRQGCRGCSRIHNCGTRAKEWMRGIKWILFSDDRDGKQRAEDLIYKMQNEFNGGI